jgi:drug/metabolite transporter (DMT)-like permease
VAIAGYLLIGRTVRQRLPVGRYAAVVYAVRQRLPVGRYAAVVYAVAAAALLVICVGAGIPLVGYDAPTWAAIAGLVVGPQLLGHTVFNAALSQVTATTVAIVVLCEPVGATLLAWLLLAELPAPGFWLAAPLVLAGVYLATARRRRAGAAPPAEPPGA